MANDKDKEREKGKGFQTLREERIRAGKSLREMEILTGEGFANLHHNESYGKHIVPRLVLRYAKALGQDPYNLMNRVGVEAIDLAIEHEERHADEEQTEPRKEDKR